MTTANPTRRFGFGFWSFIALMSALTLLFVGLGVWQMQRLAWKDALISQVTSRLDALPVPLPAAADWPTTDFSQLAFAPVTLTGQWNGEATAFIFTSLSEPKGKAGGAGYWVFTPLTTPGGAVFINRGFIPQAEKDRFASGADLPAGDVTLTGRLVLPEQSGAFTPAPDTAHRIDWVRDPARLATLVGVSGPVLPATIDLPAGPPGELPQGGETLVDFPNNHLGYALTWFGFALLTPGLLAGWIAQRMRATPKA